MKLKEKVAVVTGGNQGIGRAIALALKQHEAEVVVADLALNNLETEYGNLLGVKTDVTSKEDIEKLVNEVLKRFGKIDIFVNNAGISSIGRIWEISDEDFERNLAVNTKGVFMCMKAVTPIMMKQGSGSIINIASRAGKVAVEFQGHYGATKAAVILLTRNFANELAPFGIRVNAICPGKVDTGMIRGEWEKEVSLRGKSVEEIEKDVISQIPMRRLVQPEDVANVAVFLASDYSSAMTGQAINVSCGLEMR
jgi:NAD(P)-dependent dehydrogenase (short-subunit alcohol dehydrogenase family)